MTSNTQSEPEEKIAGKLCPLALGTSLPKTIYALVTRNSWIRRGGTCAEIAESYVIESSDSGPVLLDDEEGEYTYGECDYGGISGLIVWDGAIWTKTIAWDAATEDEREHFRDTEGFGFDEFDEYLTGKWRPMTAAEAVTLGLLAEVKLDSIPSQISEAVKAEREICATTLDIMAARCKDEDIARPFRIGAAAIRSRGES